MKWKSFTPDKRRKWYFLDDELVHVEELRYRFVFGKIPKSATVYKAIKKKYKGSIVNLLFEEPVYYIDAKAKEDGDGTQEKPFRSLNSVPDGSTVIVADGIYTPMSNSVRSVNLMLRQMRYAQQARLSELMDEVCELQCDNKEIPEELLKEIADIQSFSYNKK